MDLVVKTPLTVGHIHLFTKKQPRRWKCVPLFQAREGLINSYPFYRWTCSFLQQQRVSATDYPLQHCLLLPRGSTSKGFISRPSYSQVDLLLSSSPIRKGLIDSNPFYRRTCLSFQQQRTLATDYPLQHCLLLPSGSILERFISRPSYSWADLLLSSNPERKGLIDNNPFYCYTCSSFQQRRASAMNYPSLAALLPSSSTLEGLISKPSYSWADLLLSSSLATKDLINSKFSHIVIHHFYNSRPHQVESLHFVEQSIFCPSSSIRKSSQQKTLLQLDELLHLVMF